jgi:hypothetical protein
LHDLQIPVIYGRELDIREDVTYGAARKFVKQFRIKKGTHVCTILENCFISLWLSSIRTLRPFSKLKTDQPTFTLVFQIPFLCNPKLQCSAERLPSFEKIIAPFVGYFSTLFAALVSPNCPIIT